MSGKLLFKCAITLLLIAPPAFGAGDMLKPDEVNHEGVSARPTNDSGVFLGAGFQVGQAYTTESGATPGTAFLFHFEPGYQVNRGEFGRWEFSADLYSGTLNYRIPDSNLKIKGAKVTEAVPFGMLLKVGKGYSLGGPMYGVMTAGVGPVITKYKAALSDPQDVTATSDTTSGIAWQIGWHLVAPMGSLLDFTAGINWTQIQADIGKLKADNGSTTNYDQTAIANIPAVEAGIRIRL